MAGPEKIHAVERRGAVEYYREVACPDCGDTVFVPEGDAGGRRYQDLASFAAHRCRGTPPERFPVHVGEIAGDDARAFRATVEAAFGKRLVHFNRVLRRKGLPIHFSPVWAPSLGHVAEFSRTDVHRPLDAATPVLRLARPIVEEHYRRTGEAGLRKYFFSAAGVRKHDRSDAVPVIHWTWPAR